MFVFLAIFIVFLLYINFLMHKNKRAQENLEKQFWDREHSANFTRKKDISNLNYLIITEDKIPQNLTTDAKKSLETLCGQKMLNLSSMSNTDLKLEYGVANLDELSACDDRFSTFERNAAIYAQELIGTAFDGNWESLSGDINFDNNLQRCIAVDIRYVLFIIDKLGGCGHLIDEMTIVE